MKLEVGMYFRTKSGTINKIDSLTEDKSEFYFDTKPIFNDGECLGSKWGYTKDISKASFNVIDLIEVGDVLVTKDSKKYPINYEFETDYNSEYESYEITIDDSITLYFKDGLSIVTKECFKQMAYKVGE